MLVALRIAMPDRAGMLAAVTAAVSDIGCDIVTIDVVHRDDHQVVDDLCMELGNTPPMAVRRRVEDISGVVVESLHVIEAPPSPAAALELGIALVEAGAPDAAVTCLVEGLPPALRTTWAAVVALPTPPASDAGADPRASAGRPVPVPVPVSVLAVTTGGPASGVTLAVPWMPLDRPRRLAAGPWMPTTWQVRAAVLGLEIAAAPFGDDTTRAVIVVRTSGLRFRPPELRQLHLLASAAGRARPAPPSLEATPTTGSAMAAATGSAHSTP